MCNGSQKDQCYPCNKCDRCFAESSNLKKHMLIHRGEKRFRCAICGKRLQLALFLSIHQSKPCKPAAVDECQGSEQCGEASRRTQQQAKGQKRYTHMTKHTGKKPYGCEFCGKRFKVRGLVTRHQRTHTGERPYKCGVCNRRFVRSEHLENHTRIHTGAKPYVCEICGKRFTQSHSPKRHQQSKNACKAAAKQSRGLSN